MKAAHKFGNSKSFRFATPVFFWGLLLGACSTSGGFSVSDQTLLDESSTPATHTSPLTIDAGPSPTAELDIPSFTLLPTLEADQKQKVIFDFLVETTECKLPCWFGNMPGEATVQDVYNRVFPLALFVEHQGKETFFNIYAVYEIAGNEQPEYTTSDFYFENGELYIIRADTTGTGDRFSLPSIFREFGEPDEIWIWSRKVLINEWIISLEAYYKELGFLASYQIELLLDEENSKQALSACFFAPVKVGGLTMFDTSLVNNFQEAYQHSDLVDSFVLLNEVSEDSIDSLYSQAINSDDLHCINITLEA